VADETIAAWVPSGMGARRSLSVGAEKPSCVFRFCHSSKTLKQAHEPRLCYNNVLTSSDSSRRNPCR